MVPFCFLFFFCYFGDAQRCSSSVSAINCAGRIGIFYREGSNQIQSWNGKARDASGNLAFAICNHESFSVGAGSSKTIKGPLIPTLINRVRKSARIRVDAINSANVNLSGKLTIGEQGLAQESSLIGSIVDGRIEEGAEIYVNLQSVANVNLASSTSSLNIVNGELLAEIVHQPEDIGDEVTSICFELESSDVANVISRNGRSGHVTIKDGELEDESIDFNAHADRVNIFVSKSNVANVQCDTLDIFDGDLSDECVDAQRIMGKTDIQLSFSNVANVVSNSLTITDGELMDESVDCRRINNAGTTSISVWMRDVATVDVTGVVSITEGELLDECVDVALGITAASIDIDMRRVANVVAKELVLSHSELVDEIIDVGDSDHDVQDSTFSVKLRNVANVRLRGRFEVEDGELIDEIFDVSQDVRNSALSLDIQNVANVITPRASLTRANLLDELVDISGSTREQCQLDITVNNIGNMRGTEELVQLTESVSVDSMVDLGRLNDRSQINVQATEVGNVYCKTEGLNTVTLNGKGDNASFLVALLIDIDSLPSDPAKGVRAMIDNAGNAYVRNNRLTRDGDSRLMYRISDLDRYNVTSSYSGSRRDGCART